VSRVRLLLFARAREIAGRPRDDFDAASLAQLLDAARARYGADFGDVLEHARIWINGDEPPSGLLTDLADGDEVAVLPPVSGG